jgi:hypothetical protein
MKYRLTNFKKLSPGELTAGVDVERTSESISDLLFSEMRSLKPVTVMRQDLFTGEWYRDDSTNKYDYEADTYVNRIIFGDFSNPKMEKPCFRLDCRDLSPELKVNLSERVQCGQSSIHRVVQNAVFRLMRARRQPEYLEYIKDTHLNWRFI